MKAEYGISQDIDSWIMLVEEVGWNFPGLETQEQLKPPVCSKSLPKWSKRQSCATGALSAGNIFKA